MRLNTALCVSREGLCVCVCVCVRVSVFIPVCHTITNALLQVNVIFQSRAREKLKNSCLQLPCQVHDPLCSNTFREGACSVALLQLSSVAMFRQRGHLSKLYSVTSSLCGTVTMCSVASRAGVSSTSLFGSAFVKFVASSVAELEDVPRSVPRNGLSGAMLFVCNCSDSLFNS